MIKQIHDDLVSGKYTSVELTEKYLKNVNPDLNIYLELFDDVLEQAKKADEMIAKGEGTLLTGIPISIKDNILIKGRKVSSASKMLENYVATYDATVIEKLKKEGVVFVGRTNMDEFAMGASTENSAYGRVKNPHDPELVSGGTSGGATASVAMDSVPVALGSDTGGSVRQPSSFCGVIGLKPTYGSVSRHGLMAMGSSFDCIGPVGKTIDDVEIVFNAIKGKDELDSTSRDGEKVSEKSKYTIGVPKGILEGVDQDVVESFNKKIEDLKTKGYEIKEVELPHTKYGIAAYYIIMPAEMSTNLERMDGVRYGVHKDGEDLLADYVDSRTNGFGKEVRRRILLGTYVLSAGYYDAYYGKAQMVRHLITNDFEDAFKDVDVIATPTAPTVAWKAGEKSDPLSMYMADVFTAHANLTGMPAISIPSDTSGLPIGFQLIAPHMHEEWLFSIGRDVE